jgi:polysaccharide pyruvyl transferase WcaK-like protein
MPIAKRIKNAAQFYAADFIRESKKERQIVAGIVSAKPSISYMGWTGHNNLGDELLYEAHVALFPDFTIVPFRKSAFARAYQTVSRRPVYVAGFLGGGTLINQSDSWLQRIAYLQTMGLPIYCLGTGVTEDTFRAGHERTSMQEWVKVLATFVFAGVRGPYSKKMLEAAHFTGFTVTGDTALALAPAAFTPRRPGKIIGFNYGLVKENQIWGDTDMYTQNVAATIKQLIAKGYTVTLLPVWDRDIASNKRLLEQVNDRNCTMKLAFDSHAAYQAELQQCDIFIGQKLHATIMACMERIPSIMIEYNPKCRDFMASVAMEEYVIKTSECTPAAMLTMIQRLEKNYSTVQTTLDKHITHYRALQYETAQRISKQLLDL